MNAERDNFLIFFSLIFVVYFAVSIIAINTQLPNCDEGWFTNPGCNLIEHGFFGTTVLEETATFRKVQLKGINQYTYWIMPIYPLIQGIWGKLVGFGLIQTRLLSVFCGFFALLSWFVLIRNLSNKPYLALFSILLLAINYQFIYASSFGRMDMLSVAFGIGSLAVFTQLREKNFDHAILIPFTLTALAFYTHPLGLIWSFSLAILIGWLNLDKIKLKHFILAIVPYFFLTLAWILYISKRPDLFFIQFGGNASNRWAFFQSPLEEIGREISLRYLYNFGIGERLSQSGQIRISVIILFVLALISVSFIKKLRKQFLVKLLLILAFQEFVMLLILDSMKQHYYLIYIVPTLIIIFAIWIDWLWTQKTTYKFIASGFLIIFVLVNFSILFSQVIRNDYQQNYLTTAKFLNENMQSNETVTASAELWFSSDLKRNLTDDYKIGILSGKRSTFVVLDESRYKDWIQVLSLNNPEEYKNIKFILENEYIRVYQNERYEILKINTSE